MANDLQKLMDDLILPAALPVLREACVMPALVASDYSAEAAKQNETIQVPLPQDLGEADDFDPNTGTTKTDLGSGVVEIKLDQWKYKAFGMTDREMRESLTGGILPSAAESAVKTLANSVNRTIFGLYKAIPTFVGVPGTTPANEDALLDDREALNLQLAGNSERRAVFDSKAEKNFLKGMKDAAKTGSTNALREASLGRIYGFDNYSDQMVPKHTPGTAVDSALAVNGAAAAGATSMAVDGAVGAATLVIGDVFVVAGVEGQYVVTETVAAAGGAFPQVKFLPKLKGNAADNAAVTFEGNVGTPYTVNLSFQKNAFMWAARTLSDEASESSTISVATDPVTGIPLRLETWRDPGKSSRIWRFDILFGAKTIREALAVRHHG
ncbi:hypothetical protein NKJ26_03285 [Mesorhizobium sp. M0152]|uniref:hypothetical protein n=1 Tax=Mesorhizobium sp. M0152 TaxID=2956898 RepID=UPI00333DFB24